jgi:hypothetical protein
MSELTDKCQGINGCKSETTCNESKTCLFWEIIRVRNEEPKPRIPEFIELLDKSREIHIKKNADYASAENPFSNFEQSAIIASWFDNPVDKSFAVLIGTKLARIAELRNSGKSAQNESLADSFLDLGTYCFLWGAYVIRGKK